MQQFSVELIYEVLPKDRTAKGLVVESDPVYPLDVNVRSHATHIIQLNTLFKRLMDAQR